jgi:hypothetical protein
MNYGEPHLSWSGAGYLPQLWFLSIGSNAIDESSVSSVFLRTGMLVARKKAKNGPRRMGFGEFIKGKGPFSILKTICTPRLPIPCFFFGKVYHA